MKNWGWIIFISVLISSCLDDADCLRSGEPSIRINFRNITTGLTDTIIFMNIAAAGADSVFYKKYPTDVKDTVTTALLEVNPFANETLFTFNFTNGQKTLKVGYKNEVRFVSDECGSERFQYSLKVLETQFDSVRVVNPVLSTKRTVNIEIFK